MVLKIHLVLGVPRCSKMILDQSRRCAETINLKCRLTPKSQGTPYSAERDDRTQPKAHPATMERTGMRGTKWRGEQKATGTQAVGRIHFLMVVGLRHLDPKVTPIQRRFKT